MNVNIMLKQILKKDIILTKENLNILFQNE